VALALSADPSVPRPAARASRQLQPWLLPSPPPPPRGRPSSPTRLRSGHRSAVSLGSSSSVLLVSVSSFGS
jgi:hypothetical protein